MSDAFRAADAVASPWPVVGRDDEIDLLVHALDESGGTRVVVLGAAGVGKTRVLRETAARFEREGRSAHWIVGVPSAALPFGALAPYLPADLGDAEPAMLVGHAVRTLAMPSTVGRALVVVDDAHLLDHPSALVVSQLLHAPDVDVLCAWRSGELSPDLEWAVHDERSVVVELQPLSFDDVAVLLDSVLGPPVSESTTEVLFHHSRGSGLFLRELVADAHTAGALARGDDGWVLDANWRPGARVMELVTRRIGRRTAPEQVVLEAVAVAEPVPLDLLTAISDPEALVALERAQLVEVRADGLRAEVRFAHPLYGEAVRSRLGLAAIRQRTRALADALAATGLRRRGDLLALARWRLEGGGDLDASQWEVAARQAIALEAPEAAVIATRAVDAGAGALSWAALAQLRADARDLPGALEAFARGAERATTDDEHVLVAVGHARTLSWVADRTTDALAHLDAVTARVGTGEVALPLAITRIAVLVNAGRLPEGLAEIESVLAVENLPIEARIEALNLRAIGLAFAGRTREAREAADGLLGEALGIRHRQPQLLASAALPALVVRLIAGELVATGELVARFRSEARGAEATGYLAALEGRLALMGGRERTAMDRLLVGQESLALTMTLARSMWVGALVEEAAARLGQPADAVAGSEFDRGGDLAHRFLVVDAMRAHAAAKACRGDLPNARRLLNEGFELSREAGMVAGQIWVAYEGVRLGDGGFAEALAALAGRMDGPAGELFPRHATARIEDDPTELESTARALAEASFNRYAAGCAAEAGRAFQRRGVAGGVTRCTALAHRYAELCDEVRGTELFDLPEIGSLTPRERDVTLLAAKGLSNREIAETTSTSLRTVEGHLLRSYRKLGISSRAELASYFGDP